MLLISDGVKLVPLLKSTSPDLHSLADLNWSEISEISRSGNASKYSRVDDRKPIMLDGKVDDIEVSPAGSLVDIIDEE